MSSELEPRANSGSPAPADGDNRYKAVQRKLLDLSRALDDATFELASLRRSMKSNAGQTEDTARDIADADLDVRFVELTNLVAVSLGGAAVEVRKLHDSAQETAELAHVTLRSHEQLYGALDDIRSNRREKTPKPAFFNR
ncbi:hypothetical protein QFZ75_000050 [Streptomyces sp. V3I8]|uniref:conjugal transfer protein TraB n=1 Tax=Streptomyces sp. V3I8 TaxID=3042279 RepID=UPI00277D7703|nr:conjugal transfer protein TraB [Streptomyces sp. V3I8]MDQ1033634.1 hypothetical protein [Streptomyces sp. V3I8]